MTERDLHRLLDDAADDATSRPVLASAVVARGRALRIRRTASAVAIAIGAATLSTCVVVVVSRDAPGPVAASDANLEAPRLPTGTPGTRVTPNLGYCANTVRLNGVDYGLYVSVRRTPPLTGRLLPAIDVPCNDTGLPLPPERSIEVSEVAGVSIEDAVWFGGALHVRRGAELPASADVWLR